jgi:hypothetical protein
VGSVIGVDCGRSGVTCRGGARDCCSVSLPLVFQGRSASCGNAEGGGLSSRDGLVEGLGLDGWGQRRTGRTRAAPTACG